MIILLFNLNASQIFLLNYFTLIFNFFINFDKKNYMFNEEEVERIKNFSELLDKNGNKLKEIDQ